LIASIERKGAKKGLFIQKKGEGKMLPYRKKEGGRPKDYSYVGGGGKKRRRNQSFLGKYNGRKRDRVAERKEIKFKVMSVDLIDKKKRREGKRGISH